MDFAFALHALKLGHLVARNGWNETPELLLGHGQWLEMQFPDEFSKMTVPYIFATTPQADRVPWVPSQIDITATDWEIVLRVAQ